MEPEKNGVGEDHFEARASGSVSRSRVRLQSPAKGRRIMKDEESRGQITSGRLLNTWSKSV
jgi:hypothetical protein